MCMTFVGPDHYRLHCLRNTHTTSFRCGLTLKLIEVMLKMHSEVLENQATADATWISQPSSLLIPIFDPGRLDAPFLHHTSHTTVFQCSSRRDLGHDPCSRCRCGSPQLLCVLGRVVERTENSARLFEMGESSDMQSCCQYSALCLSRLAR